MIRYILLLPFFFIDVRVRAEEVNCWGQELPCAVASETRTRLESPGLELVLGKGALIERRERDVVQLVKGDVLVKSEGGAVFNTPYARFRCAGPCGALFERDTESITLKALKGDWIVTRIGETREYALTAGTQIAIGEVREGAAAMDFPQSLPWEPTVKKWAALYMGESSSFRKEVTEFRKVWREAVETATRVQEEVARRNIASHEQRLSEERRRQARREEADRELRELFRRKNGFD